MGERSECPVHGECQFQANTREMGMILERLTAIKECLDHFRPIVERHEAQLQRQIGYQALLSLVAGMIGAVIGFVMSWFIKVK